jgi:hypothetical protein
MDGAELLRRYARIWRGDAGTIAMEQRLFAEVLAQPDAEQVLVDAVEAARAPHTRSVVLSRLGRVEGPLGVDVLRRHAHASGAGSRDVRGAALAGLTRRLGDAATPDLRDALRHRDSWTRVCALKCLLSTGDLSAWDDAVAVWSGWMRSGRTQWAHPEFSVAVHLVYLLRDVDRGSERAGRLVEAVRSRSPVVDRGWFERFWPDALPDGPPTAEVAMPDPQRVLRWYLHTYAGFVQEPSTGLRFRVEHSQQLHGHGPDAIGELLAGGPDVWQDDRKRLISIDGAQARTYVGVGTATVGGVDHHLLSLPYARDVRLPPGSVVEVLD